MSEDGIPAVPIFWLATEDHDFAEVNHSWIFGPDHRPVRVQIADHGQADPEQDGPTRNGSHPVGGIPLGETPLAELRKTLAGFPFAEEAIQLIERAYGSGETMGSAFAHAIRELFAPWNLLLIDPMSVELRAIAAPLMRQAVEQMPELSRALAARSSELIERGYHAQVLVDDSTSLVFLLENGRRIALRRSNGHFHAEGRQWTAPQLVARAEQLSPNALLRPVVEDYLLPTAAYVGGPAELAYLAQSQVLYERLLGRQPVAFPRAGFTLLDERSVKRIAKYRLSPADLFVREQLLKDTVAARLVPRELTRRLEETKASVAGALDLLSADLHRFDITLAAALETSRRKIEYQIAKIGRKSAKEIFARDEQARRDAASLSGLIFPEGHLQERLYSIVPFLAQFGPKLIGDLYEHVRIECPDHQFALA